jgi:hypothetical protein
MCAIHDIFGEHPLEEAGDSSSRFQQAFAEAGIAAGQFRDAVFDGLTDDNRFATVEQLEDGLRAAAKGENPQEQMTAFVSALAVLSHRIEHLSRTSGPFVV